MIIDLRCPKCGRETSTVTSRKFQSEMVAVIKCQNKTRCAYEWLVHLTITPSRQPVASAIPNRGIDPACGTDSGYMKHVRSGEPTCRECRRAHALAGKLRAERKRA